jgi:hypothetical protein
MRLATLFLVDFFISAWRCSFYKFTLRLYEHAGDGVAQNESLLLDKPLLHDLL